MPYGLLNRSNPFDPISTTTFATVEDAEAKATELLKANPALTFTIIQLVKNMHATARVTVKSQELVDEVVEEPVAEDAAPASTDEAKA